MFFRERPSDSDYREFTFRLESDGSWVARLTADKETATAKGTLIQPELGQFWEGLEEAGAWETQEEPGIRQADQVEYDMVLRSPNRREHILYCYGSDHPNVTETLYFLNASVVGRARKQLSPPRLHDSTSPAWFVP
jgi:hypothetical protein